MGKDDEVWQTLYERECTQWRTFHSAHPDLGSNREYFTKLLRSVNATLDQLLYEYARYERRKGGYKRKGKDFVGRVIRQSIV